MVLYDESLSLTRAVGEIANLLFLFAADHAAYAAWKAASKAERLREFSPFKIRLRIEAAGIPIPVDQHRYAALSERAAHATPDTRPQVHSPSGRPVLGEVLQPVGALVALNELCFATGVAAASAIRLLDLDKERKEELKASAIDLIRAAGAVNILTVPDLMERLRTPEEPSASEGAAPFAAG